MNSESPRTSPLAGENSSAENLIDRRISSSALKAAKKSTRDFIWYYQKPKETKSYFDFGSAIELYLLDGDEFEKQVAVFDDAAWVGEVMAQNPASKSPRATNIYKDLRSEWESKNADKLQIPSVGADSMEVIKKIAELCMLHPDFHLLHAGGYQEAYEWICPRTGLKRYSRPDIAINDQEIIIDMKTDGNDDFERACVKNDYWLQAFDQMVGAVESGAMKEVRAYYWFVITKTAPYFVEFYKLDLEQLLRVEETYWSTLMRLKEDLSGSPEKIVWKTTPIRKIVVPNYYK